MAKILLKFFFVISGLCLPFGSHAYYPSTLWSSDRIAENLIGIRVGKVLGDGQTDFVALSPDKLLVYRIADDKLVKQVEWAAEGGTTFMKLDLFDLEGDGVQEILISGFRHEQRVQSLVARIESGQVKVLDTVPYYLRSLAWEGKKALIAQKGLSDDDYTGPLLKMAWDGKKLATQGQIKLPGGLSGKSMPIYSVEGIRVSDQSGGFLYLASSGKLQYFEGQSGQFKKKWASGEDYGGSVFYLNREARNALNQVEQGRFFVPPSFHTMGRFTAVPTVYVVRNSGYLKNVVGAVPSVKNAQLVRLIWTGYGFQENWNSPRLDGAISDFAPIDWEGDGKEELVATFLLRDRGYVDTLKKQDSLLIVLKPESANP